MEDRRAPRNGAGCPRCSIAWHHGNRGCSEVKRKKSEDLGTASIGTWERDYSRTETKPWKNAPLASTWLSAGPCIINRMCGRYVVKTPIKTIAKMHRVFDAPLFEPRYTVAPTQIVPIARAKDAGRELALVRWGLIPAWAKDAKICYRLINARTDSVASKPSFRTAFEKRRCLLPADGFYE